MKQLTKHPTTRHGTRGVPMPHITHPRPCRIPPADFADVLQPTFGTPLSALLTGGDVDADRMRAWDCGDEAVGGSVATPDQDIVDELGRALGVAREPDAEVWTSHDILRERDRHRWQQEE
jgi:hypothetical protein